MGSNIKQIIYRAQFMLFIPGVQIFYFILNNYRDHVYNVGTLLDRIIPFNKYFIIPYIYWYVYVFGVLVYFLFVDYKNYYRLLMTIISGALTCFIIYYFFPTTVPRPDISGDDIFTKLVQAIYRKDNPYNCLPSIHVLDTMIVTLYIFKHNKSKILNFVGIISCVSIILSTFFVKQHYVLDAVAGAFLATSYFLLYTNEQIWTKIPVRKLYELIIPQKSRNNYMKLD